MTRVGSKLSRMKDKSEHKPEKIGQHFETTPVVFDDDIRFEKTLRPVRFEEFVGQNKIKEKLKIYIEAAKRRGEPLDHVLLMGPPGLGKTTLANIIANELGVGIISAAAPSIERPGDLAGILTQMEEKEVLFIDEIHRLDATVEEYLYGAMEDFKLSVVIDRGPGAKSLELSIKPFTLIGATTRAGLLSTPFISRFGILERLDYYGDADLQSILRRSSEILKVSIEDAALKEIAKRSRGTPRIANRLLRRTRDFAQIDGKGNITLEVVSTALEKLSVNDAGLDEIDMKILDTIVRVYKGGPVGVNALAAIIGESPETIEEVYEPYLLQNGFIRRTLRGREAAERAYDILRLRKPVRAEQPDLEIFNEGDKPVEN